jgi:hypothetical protein
MSTTLSPTAEQVHGLDVVKRGGPVKVRAYAGAGKTAWLRMVADMYAAKRGRYLAFNREIALAARSRFRGNVQCQTVNALAFASVSRDLTARLNMPKEPPALLARRYGLSTLKVSVDGARDFEVSEFQIGRMIADGSARFCRSAQSEPQARHIPVDERIGKKAADELRALLLPHVVRHWNESVDPRGTTAISADVYMKAWALSAPVIPGEFLLIDECQDSDGILLSVLRHQPHAQVIYVGDPYQQLYDWRGAINAMDHIRAPECALTESFRFGPDFAMLASKILLLLGERTPLRGQAHIASMIVTDPDARPNVDAVLCRKNATVIGELVAGLAAGHKVAVRINAGEILAFADGAERLKRGQRTHAPAALSLFESWSDVQEYARSHAGRDLLSLVMIIDNHGISHLRQMLASVTQEAEADYVVSTIHGAKGLEWNRVRVMGDFRYRTDGEGRLSLDDDEARLMYVGLTRARQVMDVSSLADDLIQVIQDAKANPSARMQAARAAPSGAMHGAPRGAAPAALPKTGGLPVA